MNRVALAIALVTLPHVAIAEGAKRVFDCVSVTFCNETGDCVPSGRNILFQLEPQDVGPDGVGSYTISYEDVTVDARQIGPIGPFLWAETGEDKQSLMPLAEGAMLWHRLDLTEAPESRVIFLNCEVTS